ncbi:MAG: L,D-transpeptidase family protein [Azospirillum sp.]|nr:L,D-transpeptidase family protein [Azospirillum sp.]
MARIREWGSLVLVLALVGCQSPVRLPPPKPDDNAGLTRMERIVVEKAAHRLHIYRPDEPPRTYQISLGGNPRGAKEQRGDKRTPEGVYLIVAKNPDSNYHRSLKISYPSPEDRARAQKRGIDPGDDIMIHGLPNGKGWIGDAHRTTDWTNGCIAVTDQEIDEIWRLVPVGTPIEIKP